MGTLVIPLHTHLGSMRSARVVFANSHSLYCCAREGWQVLTHRKPQMSNCLQSSYLENHPNSREKCPGIATSHPTTRCAGGMDRVLKTPQMSSFNSLSLPRCFYSGWNCSQTSSALFTPWWGLCGSNSQF
uniref:Uncharacterized protein n=1 Tax=Rousettus aegyptiacus TaxID=9407 RepID=A0A7J8GAH2_ROUAE|nr:hypothetical protein HJG63_011486 [Rousettus aegyptiacus]